MSNQRESPTSLLPTSPFQTQEDWALWLQNNHHLSSGIWLQLAKKGTAIPSISYDEAVETALCYGWIDGQKKAHNEQYWLQKFTPRSKKSIWSKINQKKVITLIEAGKMKAAGLAEVERAKSDGRWEAAYDSASTSVMPDDFQATLERHPQAKEFFDTLESRNRYAILFRIQTTKNAEARAKKILYFIEMLERNEKMHP